MSDERDTTPANEPDVSEVPHAEWPGWCAKATSDHSGREVVLRQADQALGEVRLGAGQRLVAIEHDALGPAEALTIKCGSSAVPVSYAVAQPRTIRQHHDRAGELEGITIIDSTGRQTHIDLA